MKKPFFSIIINNYNYSAFLNTAIESALKQSYDSYEVIVVDDGSTDNSAEIINSYNSRVIAVFKKNGGQSSAFNAGFERSKGDLIWFLDADDYLNTNALEVVAKHYKETIAIYYTRLQNFSKENHNLGLVPSGELPHQGDIFDSMKKGIRNRLPPTSALIFSRTVLNKVMPIERPEAFRYSSDIYLTTRACFHGDILGIDFVSGNYRIHQNNHTYKAEFDINLLRRRMMQEIDMHSIRFRDAKAHNIEISMDYATWDIGHCYNRLVHYILHSKNHPVMNDSRISLWKKSLITISKTPNTSIPKKILRLAKFSVIAIAPKFILIKLIGHLKLIRTRSC